MLSRFNYRIHAVACRILIGLGTAHVLGTLVDVFAPTFFAPDSPRVLAQMRATLVELGAWVGAERLSVWNMHLGCSFSTGFGLALIGAVQLLVRRANPILLASTPIVPLATVITIAWAVIAASWWFWVPLLGITLAALGFAWTWYALRGVAPPAPAPAADMRLLWLGALAMGMAGALHGLGTIPDIFVDGVFAPVSPAVRRAMTGSDVMLPSLFEASTPIWSAYLGYHLSHGLGVAGFALTPWLMARDLPCVIAHDRDLQALYATLSLLWFAVALAFWFYAPMLVSGMAATCHLALMVRQRRTLPISGQT
ncbi:MAG: hypothetical protein FJ271_28250 [Planctomycetes bacterium]|nr:hypothetical protein [Planctomycetota bacterium]